MIAAVRMDEPAKLTDTIAANLQLSIEEKQELLEIFDPAERLARIADVLDVEIEKLNMDRTIQSRVKRQMERAQKEYYLNEKIKAIQKELGRGEKSEFDELKKKIEAAGMPKEVLEKALPGAEEARGHASDVGRVHRLRNYLDWLLACRGRRSPKKCGPSTMPKRSSTKIITAWKRSRSASSNSSPSANWSRIPRARSSALSDLRAWVNLAGMSIAKATGRKFVRMSLGGVRDEAEIRGHRRTYIGALPGQIIQSMKKAGTRNPVFMLDEVDKMASDFRGDPSPRCLRCSIRSRTLASRTTTST